METIISKLIFLSPLGYFWEKASIFLIASKKLAFAIRSPFSSFKEPDGVILSGDEFVSKFFTNLSSASISVFDNKDFTFKHASFTLLSDEVQNST